MRYLTICLLGSAALTSACQPITPSSMSVTLADPKAAKPTSTQALVKTVSINNSQDTGQTETKPAVANIPSSNNVNTTSKSPESVVPQIVLIAPKAFNPEDIIDFTIPVLIRDLGHAKITRQEGPAEIWQYHFKNCVVDFFFYSINEFAPKLTAKSWDMRSPMIGSNLDRAACLAEINIYHQNVLANR